MSVRLRFISVAVVIAVFVTAHAIAMREIALADRNAPASTTALSGD